MPSTPVLPPPNSNQAFCHVSALEAGLIDLKDEMFITPAIPGKVTTAPSLSFLLVHSGNEQKFIFDLGIRKDWQNYPPATVDWVERVYPVRVDQDVVESLAKGGTSPEEIDFVCISHAHWDHVGDTLPFNKSQFIVGAAVQSILGIGYPADQNSFFSSTLFPSDRTRFLEPSAEEWKPLGPFPLALDFYGDGSLYIVDAPGHLPGHINILARTSADGSWVYLAGDSAHHWNLITGEATVPVGHPGHIGGCAHVNKDEADVHIARVREVWRMPEVKVFLAHDEPWYTEHKGGNQFWPGFVPPAKE